MEPNSTVILAVVGALVTGIFAVCIWFLNKWHNETKNKKENIRKQIISFRAVVVDNKNPMLLTSDPLWQHLKKYLSPRVYAGQFNMSKGIPAHSNTNDHAWNNRDIPEINEAIYKLEKEWDLI